MDARNLLTHVLKKVDTHSFTDKGGHCWEGYYRDEVQDAYNDEDNLQTMCSSCNPGKSGPKSYDRDNPTKYRGKKGGKDDEKE